MKSPKKHVIIIAGEASGDMHAACLVDEIKKRDPHITFSGLGGAKMQQSGVELYEDLTRLAVIGFIEVLKHYTKIKEIFTMILRKVYETKADAVILVDYPGFNLRLAKELKTMNVKVIYYISPQVWAWKPDRVKTVKACTDKMLVLFDFEKDFYARHHLCVDFVGHPLVDAVGVTSSRENILRSFALSPDRLTVGMLPGSRQKEIETLLPVMLDAAAILKKENPDTQFILVKASTVSARSIGKFLKNASIQPKIISDNINDGIYACDICMVASGTATLQTAILNKPMVVIYKISLLTWAMAKLMIKIPYIGLVNVVAGKKIVPECIQFEATGKNIAAELKDIYTDKDRMSQIKTELAKVKRALGPPGASQRAAAKVLEVIHTQN